MREIVAAIEAAVPAVAGRVSYDDRQLPFPEQVEPHAGELFAVPPETPLLEGVRKTIERFQGYLSESGDL
jgi:hypothetical protein